MQKKMKKSGCLILFFLGLAVSIFPSAPETMDIKFEHISIKEGLSQSIVECIAQESCGFIWFGTEDGLNRYDGYKFTILRNEPQNPNSLGHNNILVIYEDQFRILWIGTFHGGLTRFDPENQKYTVFKKNPDDPNSLSSDVVRAIVEAPSGVLWIGTDDGLNKLDTKTGTFTHYKHEPHNPGSLGHNEVYSICADRPGVLWIGTNGGGLDRFDIQSGTFTHFKAKTGDSKNPGSNEILKLFKDRSGVLWIGTHGGGLFKFDNNTRTFTCYKANPNAPHAPQSLSNNIVRAIYEDQSGFLWVGTGAGLNRFDRETGTFTSYLNDPRDTSSLTHNEIRSIYEDVSGVLWIGTYGGGINKINPKRKKFLHYQSNPNDPNSLSHDIVWSIYEDRMGILWIGTHGGGLNKFDRKANRFTVYRSDPRDPKSLSNDAVRLVYEDRAGMLWVGTNGGGLDQFDRETGIFTHYKNEPGNPHSLSHNEIRAIYEDRAGDLWIGTHGGGLNRLNREAGTFTRFQPQENNPDSLSNNVARVICQDHKGTLWIGTYGGGLNKFNRETGTFTHYRANPQDPNSLSNDYIFAIHEDQSHYLWIGTWGGGLNRFNPATGTFKHFRKTDGLPSDSIYGILEDRQGNLWLSTNKGLIRFNPGQKTFRNYLETDGLQSNEFNGGSYFKSRSGEMFFGGINGFNAFYPDAIKDNPHIPPIVITSFQKLNKEVKLGQSISCINELTLSYKDYFFSFEFAALDYTIPSENKYAYKMVGLDEDWIYTGADKRFAAYTTLAPGKYIFRVKGSNNDGIWNEEGTSIIVTITPPLWRTWWFQGISVILVLLIIWSLYKKRMNNLFLRTRMETELQTAHNAQMSIMPHRGPEIQGFDISGVCVPANEVGGDFFDYLWLNSEEPHLGIVVGDVSGKAMKAAMTAVMANGIIFSKSSETRSISEIMSRLNQSLYVKTEKQIFAALLIISIETSTKRMTYTNAGLPEPLLKSGHSVTGLESSGSKVPLGVYKEKDFTEDHVQLSPGDIVVLFTDGISEARNSQQEFYGSENLKRFLESLDTVNLSSKEIVDKIMDDIGRFSGGVDQFDDITVVVVKVL
jgi:ligand-binding sensor domain-containing protein/serine phosphatase RsbU (regulator of sigma subunit)